MYGGRSAVLIYVRCSSLSHYDPTLPMILQEQRVTNDFRGHVEEV